MNTFSHQDKSASIDDRVNSLLNQMTVEEKIAQLSAIFIQNLTQKDDQGAPQLFWEKIHQEYEHGLGRISAMSHAYGLKDHIRLYNELQHHFINHTRLGIPFLADCEALHGCMAPSSTSYPQAIALASSWNTELVETIAKAIGQEVKARGNHQVLSPVLDLAQDPRCGRVEETYGEDPLLVSRMSVAYVRGVQSENIATTPKHFAANFVASGGRDSYPIELSERALRETHLKPYEAVVKEANAMGIMSAYHTIDGIPCSSNRWLLTTLLREEWGFTGAVTSDWSAANHLHDYHHVVTDYASCAEQCLNAGLDIEQPFTLTFKHVPELIKQGRISMQTLDEAVRRLLYVKFWTGLIDHPYFDESVAINGSNTEAQRQLAFESACQGTVLLKNEGILPLDFSQLKSIAIIGPHADNPEQQKGGYATTGTNITPLRNALEAQYAKHIDIKYAKGCDTLNGTPQDFDDAVDVAKQSEIVLLCLGGAQGLTEGEGFDRTTLRLPDIQEELLAEVTAANPNTIVILSCGKAVEVAPWLDHAPALLMSWYLSQEGGNALVELLSGSICPSGKLPVTFPIETGQCPCPYNHKPTGRLDDYVNLRGKQYQFEFGFGLSYTTFDYRNLSVTSSGTDRDLSYTFNFDLTNTGQVAGSEIVQLYLRDETSKRSRPVKELKSFERVSLAPGETRNVCLQLNWHDLAYLGDDLQPTLEDGNLIFMIGASSEDIRLRHETQPRSEIGLDQYQVSPLQPPQLHQSWASVELPELASIKWEDAPMTGGGYFTCTHLVKYHKGKHGMVYFKTKVGIPEATGGMLSYGSDAAVKVWLNGDPIAVECFASAPLVPDEYQIPVDWKQGENELIFAVSTNEGEAWGITATARY